MVLLFRCTRWCSGPTPSLSLVYLVEFRLEGIEDVRLECGAFGNTGRLVVFHPTSHENLRLFSVGACPTPRGLVQFGAHLHTEGAGMVPRFSCEFLEPRFVPTGNRHAPAVPDLDRGHRGRAASFPARLACQVNSCSCRPGFECRKQPGTCGGVVLDHCGKEE